jgi:mono/diheme cytochrome c family protein
MKKAGLRCLLIANAIIALNVCASAQNVDLGKTEYRSGCAACHGFDAKGNGPISKELKTHPADLTVLAKKNNGVFPFDNVHKIIDGRDPLVSHGTREMPIWGYRFTPPHYNLQNTDDYTLSPPASSEAIVSSRILAVIDYLNRIQEK